MSFQESDTLPTIEQYKFAAASMENMGIDPSEALENDLVLSLYKGFLAVARRRYPVVLDEQQHNYNQEEIYHEKE